MAATAPAHIVDDSPPEGDPFDEVSIAEVVPEEPIRNPIRIMGIEVRRSSFDFFCITSINQQMPTPVSGYIKGDGTVRMTFPRIREPNEAFSKADRVSVFIRIVQWLILCYNRGVCPATLTTDDIRVYEITGAYGGGTTVRLYITSRYRISNNALWMDIYRALTNLFLEYNVLRPHEIEQIDSDRLHERLQLHLVSLAVRSRESDGISKSEGPYPYYTMPLIGEYCMTQQEICNFIDDTSRSRQFVAFALSMMHHSTERVVTPEIIDVNVLYRIFDSATNPNAAAMDISTIDAYAAREWVILSGRKADAYTIAVRFKYSGQRDVNDIMNGFMRSINEV